MKRITLVALFVLITVSVFAQANGKVITTPNNPIAGMSVMVTYTPPAHLASGKEIKMIVRQIGLVLSSTDEVAMIQNGKDWQGSFVMADTSKCAILVFTGNGKKDDNSKKGYLVNALGKDGKAIPGTAASIGLSQIMYSDMMELQVEKEKTFDAVKNDLDDNPNLKREYISYYLSAISGVLKEKGNELILAELQSFTDPNVLTEVELNTIINWYARVKAADKAAPFKKTLEEKFPLGTTAQMQKYQEFRAIKDLEAKVKFVDDFQAKFKESIYLPYFQNSILTEFNKALQFDKSKEYLETKIKNPKHNNYNSIAWAMYEKGGDLFIALGLSAKAVELSKKEVESPSIKTPFYMSNAEFKKNNEQALGANLDTYGAILLKLNKNEDALAALETAAKLALEKESDTNERFVQALIANGKLKEAQSNIEKYIVEGTGSEKMREMLKDLFVKTGGVENSFEKYFEKFEKQALARKTEELKKEIINEAAPQFTLLDLDGKSVSLADFKGKTVIVDFWATWCGPCLSSFPGMQKAVEKYTKDGSVAFLFVNTWENVENKKQNAADFIKKNNYPFHVLMDEKNEVITAYKVSGIPTKFIIDKNGFIRFKSVGFGGDANKMVEEIGVMISMIK